MRVSILLVVGILALSAYSTDAQVTAGCPAGEEKRPVCKRCEDGSVKATAGVEQCTECPPGTDQDLEDKTLPCRDCRAGYYAPNFKTGSCLPCDNASWQSKTGQPSCDRCPDGSAHGQLAVTDPSTITCRCIEGYYTDDPVEKPSECKKCPTGAICPGGAAHPVAEPGYWVDPNDGEFVRNCRPAEACEGGIGNPCNERYENGTRLCFKCAEGNFRQFIGDRCTKCPFNGWGVVCIILIPVTVTLVSFIVAMYAREPALGIPYVVLNFIQVTSLFAEVNVDYPTTLQRILTYFSIFNANPDIFGFECLLDYQQIWALQMALPLFYLLSLYILYIVASKKAKPPIYIKKGSTPKDHMIQTLLVLMCMSQIYLARSSTEVLDCSESGNEEFWLDSAPYITCTRGTWVHMLPASIVGTLVYCIGLPIFMLTRIFKVRRILRDNEDNPVVTSRYGFLVLRFRPEAFYWEILTLVYKVMMMFFVKFLSLRPTVVVILIMCTTLPLLAAHLLIRPHNSKLTNTFEAAALGFECYMAMIMLVFHFDVFDESSHTAVVVVAVVGMVVIIVGGAFGTFAEYRRLHAPVDPEEKELLRRSNKISPGDATDDQTDSGSYYTTSEDEIGPPPELVSVTPGNP